ncbi:hypothetical protein [Acidiphilium sp. C61]|uniref:hypothetical protein n=1 Tax=Acidiphilium sp. C61 TaxID=1671485 RepID=UPI00157A3C94|nr:hypothetical protein [Acidiphilium sp. C61]
MTSIQIEASNIEALKARIRALADAAGDAGWLEIAVDGIDRPVIRVPRGAFEQWSVGYARAPGVAPWTTVCPMGLKQGFDDPLHSDWMLGAGLPLDAMKSNDDLSDSIYRARANVERRLLQREASVLLAGPDVEEGVSIHPADPADMDCLDRAADKFGRPVLVLPDLRPDWLPLVIAAFERGGAVIATRGGAMAHLVTEARAAGKGGILRLDNAWALFPDGVLLRIEPAAGRVTFVQAEEYRLARLAAALQERPAPVQDRRHDTDHAPARVAETEIRMSVAPSAIAAADRCRDLIAAGKLDIPGIGHFAATIHSSRDNLRGEPEGVLLVHGFSDGASSRRLGTAASNFRTWQSGDIARATRQAASLLCPELDQELAERRARAEAARQTRMERRRAAISRMGDTDLAAEMQYLLQQREGNYQVSSTSTRFGADV